MVDKAFSESINDIGFEHFKNSIPLIRGDFIKSLITNLSRKGLDPEPIYKQAKLNPILIEQGEMIAIHPVRQFFKAAYDVMTTETFTYGIQGAIRHHLVPHFIKQLPSHFTVREILTRFNILIRDSAPVASQYLVEEENEAWFCRASGNAPMDEWEEVFTAVYSVELIRHMVGTLAWFPKRICLRQESNTSFIKVIPPQIQVLYGQDEHKVEVDKSILGKAIKNTDSDRDEIEWHSTFADTVYIALLPYVNEHELTIELAAELFDMSTRSFQRKLQQEKTSFRSIKNSLMFDTASQLMSKSLSLTQISAQLGYADISHFSRAFKRFSGLTPRVYQKALIESI